MALLTPAQAILFQVVLARAVMIATGAGMVYIGYRLLTTPGAIPVTVGIWLVAALTIGLGARGKIQRGWGGFDASPLDVDDRV